MEGKTDDKEGVSMEGSKLAAAILGEVRRAVVGKDAVLAKVLLAILAATSCWRTFPAWARPPWLWPSPGP